MRVQAAYLLAVLAEHPSTHQLITGQGSIAALLQIMHTACRARTSSTTLDIASGSVIHKAGCSDTLDHAAAIFSCHDATALAASAPTSSVVSSVESSPGIAHGLRAVSDIKSANQQSMDGEGTAAANATHESSSGEERTEDQAALQGCGDLLATSSASAANRERERGQQQQEQVDSSGTTCISSGAGHISSGSMTADCMASAAAAKGTMEACCSSADNGEEDSRGKIGRSIVGEGGAADKEISSSSIHSRLLKAARAAKSSAVACSSSSASVAGGIAAEHLYDGQIKMFCFPTW